MNVEIGELIKGHLQRMKIADKITGLVRTVEREITTGVKERFPVAYNEGHLAEDLSGQYSDFVPDSQHKTITYLEDNGIKPTTVKGDNYGFVSSFNIICWLNTDLLNVQYSQAGTYATVYILKALPKTYFNGIDFNPRYKPFNTVLVEVVRVLPSDARLFSRYTYQEHRRQYLMHPYTAVGVEISVSFNVNLRCVDDLLGELKLAEFTKDFSLDFTA